MSDTLNNFIDTLCCPCCKKKLHIGNNHLYCAIGHEYQYEKNVINFTNDIVTVYDKHWHKYDSSPLKDKRSEDFFNWSTQFIDYNDIPPTVLDLGCGDGNHTPYFKNYKYIAVDISTSIYDLAFKYRGSCNMIFEGRCICTSHQEFISRLYFLLCWC